MKPEMKENLKQFIRSAAIFIFTMGLVMLYKITTDDFLNCVIIVAISFMIFVLLYNESENQNEHKTKYN